jgi:hypothetical protein
MAQAVPQARPRKERPHTARRAVKAIGEDAPDPIRRLLLERRLLKLAVRLGKSRCTGGLGVAQMPDDTATDNALPGSNRAILGAKELHFIPQRVARCPEKRSLNEPWRKRCQMRQKARLGVSYSVG